MKGNQGGDYESLPKTDGKSACAHPRQCISQIFFIVLILVGLPERESEWRDLHHLRCLAGQQCRWILRRNWPLDQGDVSGSLEASRGDSWIHAPKHRGHAPPLKFHKPQTLMNGGLLAY
jgi:hypothetical protein